MALRLHSKQSKSKGTQITTESRINGRVEQILSRDKRYQKRNICKVLIFQTQKQPKVKSEFLSKNMYVILKRLLIQCVPF